MGHRFFADENFPLPATERPRELGHDVLTVAESGHSGIAWPDEAVLDYAGSVNRVVLTLNRRHFIRLHGEVPDHSGIVVCLYESDFRALAERIHAVTSRAPSLRRRLIRVNRSN